MAGLDVPVHEMQVSALPFNRRWPGHQRSEDQRETAYFISFDMDEPVTVIVKPDRVFQNVVIRPSAAKIQPAIQDGALTFVIERCGGYTVELDGYHQALHVFANPFKIYAVDLTDENTLYFGAGVHDVVYEHIDVEYDPVFQRPQIQESDSSLFVFDPESTYMPTLLSTCVTKHHEYSHGAERRGKIHDITFRDIRVTASRMPPSWFVGYDEQHQSSDIRIIDLYLNGQRVTTLDQANVRIGKFAERITIEEIDLFFTPACK